MAPVAFDRRRFLEGAAATFAGTATLSLPTFARAAGLSHSFPALKALADSYVAERKVAGMIIGVAAGDAPDAYVGAGRLGWGRAAEPAPASIWRIYSMSKPVTGALATMLIADGKLGIDQPIAEFLPAFANMRVATNPAKNLESVPAKTPITVRHLLTHTAGLTYHFQPKSAVAKAYRKHGLMPGLRTLGREHGDGAPPTNLQDFAAAVAELPLVAEPGTTWHYSIAHDVLGAVIEKAGGAPFEAQLKSRVFDPLGMSSTGFEVAATDMERFATNYYLQRGKLIAIDVPPKTEFAAPGPYPSGGGGLVSTAHDYLRFMRMLGDEGRFDGREIMAGSAARMATSNLLPAGVYYEGNQGFGAGGLVVLAPSRGIIGSFGWGGAAGTLASTVPGKRLSTVLMTQYMPQETYPLPAELAKALSADLAG